MKLLNIVVNLFKEKKRQAVTNRNLALKKSDIHRWKKEQALFDDWNERTKIMAGYVPENVRLLEFGAAKLALKQFLPKTVKYTPSDIVDRGEGTIVCDLNTQKQKYPEFKDKDIIFFSGVLEYVFDVPYVIQFFSKKTNKFIISYCTSDNFSSETGRKINGWVNNYSNKDIISIFEKNNFKLTETNMWRKQNIYVFEKKE